MQSPAVVAGRAAFAALAVILLPFGGAWTAAAASSNSSNGDSQATLRFGDPGYTTHGEWSMEASVTPARWRGGDTVQFTASVTITSEHLASLASNANIRADGLCVLITAERTFDAQGRFRQANDERMSTLLTPTGLPIEGGVQGAVTNRFGAYAFRTPVDQLVKVALPAPDESGKRTARFAASQELGADFPPGIYRVRLDFGVTAGTRFYSLDGGGFAQRPFFKGRPVESHVYSPPVPAGTNGEVTPRIPWILLGNYNSNGYRGVVADEDAAHFGISGRNLIQDDVILPRFDAAGKPLSYSLEPVLLADSIEARSNIPWDFSKGEISVRVYGEDGVLHDLGTAPIVGKTGVSPTTRRAAFTAWRPPAYGAYVVRVSGWMADIWGNVYEGGGFYRFWIAKRMTMATATFQGMSYPVGNRYGRDIGFAPAFPADVEVTATLYPYSDASRAKTKTWRGRASLAGTYGSAQGADSLPLDEPGEYKAQVLAKYVDRGGHLWVCSMRHAGVVYPADSAIVARGKKLPVSGKYLDRGETKFEGWVDTAADKQYLAHINFPWNQGDVLLIASEGQGANKIEPVLTWEPKVNPPAYDTRLNGIGSTNLALKTSNGLSPHLYPEFVTEWSYYYAAAPRPGFMSRFLVAEHGARAPYWPTSPNSFGGQINASANGDMPGDIYRLIGGAVLRRAGETPQYAGYLASAFLLPKDSKNNRVIAPGSEDVLGPTGEMARVFLVGLRPGMTYLTGASFAPAVQIDPILPVNLRFTMTYPDGRTVRTSGVGDAAGSFAARDRWTLDVPGIYRYTLEGDWQGHRAVMPGLPAAGGEFYVLEAERPAGVPELTLDMPAESSFSPVTGLTINGRSTGEKVYFAAVIPGAVIDQGELPVVNGRFQYVFTPAAVHARTPTYDIENRVSGRSEIGEVVHLSFFSKEKGDAGKAAHSFARVILRGTVAICVK